MIRVLKGSRDSGVLFRLLTHTMGEDNGGWSAAALLLVLDDSFTVSREVSFDYLDDDIFGDNITYSAGSPVEHHWNSIVNYQSKGNLVLADLRAYAIFDRRHPNLWTGGAYPVNTVEFSGNKGVSYDLYRKLPKPDYILSQHLFANWKYDHLHEIGFGMSSSISVYRVNGTPSFNRWSIETSRVFSFSTSCARKTGEGYRWFTMTVSTLLFASEQPNQWAARWYESAVLTYVDDKYRQDYPLVPARLTPLADPVLHSPNYEAVFDRTHRNPNWHELAARAYQGLAFSDINGIAFLNDAAEMGAAFSSMAKTLKSIPSKRVKAAASAWLSVHYGFKLQLLDTITLRDELVKQSLRNTRESKCQSAEYYEHGGVSYRAGYQVFYNEFDQLISEFDQLVRISDLVLTSENMWDMVPYSFVIDWFISIGDVLSALDGYASLHRDHKVIAVGKSIKGSRIALPSMFGLPSIYDTSGIVLSGYFRRYSRYLETPSLLPNVTINPFQHFAEGAALIVSRR